MFILNKLDGKLSTQFFDRRGSGFAQWYAQDNRSNPYIYRRDCRNIVLAESKDRVWNSIAEKDAAYLLLPYTEEIRQRVEQLLDERYQQYLEAEFADDPEERVARAAEGKPAVIPDWDGPLFCYASDRVAQDGCKVQIMDRLFPEREDMGWESGWAFYSGDEGDVYGEGDEYYESHCGFYDIRDICRIDPDIIRLLNLPYGTMQMRGEDGAWYEVIRDDEGEEETLNEQRADHSIFTGALVHCLGAHRGRDFDWGDPQLELALRPHWYAGCPSTQQRIPACGFLSAGRPPDCGEYLGICAEIEIGGSIP